MARKIKIPNHLQKSLARGITKRKIDIRTKRKYYLIVCEGEQTEPNYFESIKERLPKGVLTSCHIEIEGAGKNTESLLDETIRLMGKWHEETGRQIDKVWIVFDRDSFDQQPFKYAKNSKEMFSILAKYGDLDFAINNAFRLEKIWGGQTDYANHKPCTKVHHLIVELQLLVKSLYS